ncbi:MAG: hypothetical protein JRN26_01115 [Nitrososphaerota archaeon]|nr:hypothetical protein [Nitrososphaerota archaeon]MDG6932919.1 hypothetical protein [Nitrososphaerota archaeon]MDG6935479.1 hypothetical protein [Nitrososphaerota archaeon]MDG6943612.1 hypothetical protein [Nitrososphaerota archaeon]
MKISIREVKRGFISKYPESKLSEILAKAPDDVEASTLPDLVETWEAIIDSELKTEAS